MAVDRKSDYVGNHGGAYTDNSGASRQFTYIDHDIKSKIGAIIESASCKEWQRLYDCIEWEDPRVKEYCNHEWGTSFRKITDKILHSSYLPLSLLQKLIEITK